MIEDDSLEKIVTIFQENEKFEYVDFKIEINEGKLKIIYLIEPKFYIEFEDKNQDILGEVCPGKFSIIENFVLTNKSELYEKIKNWLDAIWREISLASPLGLLKEEQEEIDTICQKYDSLEGYFTIDEILKIKKELESLKKELKKEIKNLVEKREMQEHEIEKLNRHFETLEQVMPYLKKKGWIRSLTGRVFHNTKRLLDLHRKNIISDNNSSANNF